MTEDRHAIKHGLALSGESKPHLFGNRKFYTVVALAKLQDLVISSGFLFPELLRVLVQLRAITILGDASLTLQGKPKTSRPCGWYLAYKACSPDVKQESSSAV